MPEPFSQDSPIAEQLFKEPIHRLGGSAATLELSEGGKTSAALALLDETGPTGGFFHFGDSVLW
jgi:hypothetical protein